MANKLEASDRSEMLLNISRRVASDESIEEIIATIIEVTTWELNAERGSLFLNDSATNELYTRFAQGTNLREIRIHNKSGIAGSVFQSGVGEIIHDAYSDDRFNSAVDQQTGYTTKNILCAPVKTLNGVTIGSAEMLNKKSGRFTKKDLELLEAMTEQASIALQSAQFVEQMQKNRNEEKKLLDVVSEVTAEIDLPTMLSKVMGEATKMLNADRSSIFLNDPKTNELWLQIGDGLESTQIRFPNHLGIAGTVFTSGETINIPHAYADLRFNPDFDKQTGYFTRSILCVPIINKDRVILGVTQVLNKRGGPFTEEDEQRLKAFTAQISVGLENAQLFADVQNMKNYNDSILQSAASGVITLDEDEKIQFLADMGMQEPGLNSIISVGYEILGLQTFFTAGPKEARAWTILKGMTAPQAAGKIHTDFQEGFIRAEVIAYTDYIECHGEIGAKEKGKWKLEGKEYVMQEGDVVHFRFNV